MGFVRLLRKRGLYVAAVSLLLSGLIPSAAYAAPMTSSPYLPPVYGTYSGFSPIVFEETLPPTPIFEWTPDMITDRKVSKREEGLDMKGVVPELTEAFGSAYEALNEQIDQIAEAKVTAAKEAKARSINFKYEVYTADTLISVILYATITSAASKTEVATLNFEPYEGTIVPMADAVGYNIAPLAEKLLTERIRRNPDTYNAAFDGLPDDQAYYLTNDTLVLLFDEFLLGPNTEGVTKLELALNRIVSVTISKLDYYPRPGYSVKMISLRQVCEVLGYEIEWYPEEMHVELYIDGTLYIELTIGANNYLVRDRKVRSLEAAPEMVKGKVYVPISFFDQILSLVTYSVDERENITFLAYLEME